MKHCQLCEHYHRCHAVNDIIELAEIAPSLVNLDGRFKEAAKFCAAYLREGTGK